MSENSPTGEPREEVEQGRDENYGPGFVEQLAGAMTVLVGAAVLLGWCWRRRLGALRSSGPRFQSWLTCNRPFDSGRDYRDSFDVYRCCPPIYKRLSFQAEKAQTGVNGGGDRGVSFARERE